MKKLTLPLVFAALTMFVDKASAVELLTSGDFEVAVGAIPGGWTLEESYTTGTGTADSAEVVANFSPLSPTRDLWLKSFAGNGPLLAANGNFDEDAMPAGDVDGNDFLDWQRGGSPTPVSAADLATWKGNFERVGGRLTNAILSNTVTGVAGQTYTFKGASRWEANYSGGVATLDPLGPLGAVASPTETFMEIQFLNGGGTVIGSKSLDLRTEQQNANFWSDPLHQVSEVAPVGTAQVRVRAGARNMVWNGSVPGGPDQSAFFDSFSLNSSGGGGELLPNPGLDENPPSALDAWVQTEFDPNNPLQEEVIRTAGFANHTAGGSTGIWWSAFLGEVDTPVDGTLSQTKAAVPGGMYTFTGWSRWEANFAAGLTTIPAGPDVGKTSPTKVLMELAFLDSADAVIGPPIVLDIKANRLLSSANANDGEWRMHTLSGTAPATAAKVRVSGIMIDGVATGVNPQSGFFDDFSLQGPMAVAPSANAVPEPAAATGLAFLALAMGHWNRRRRTSR